MLRRDQLVHAVDPGQYVAACGVIVHVVGQPWPDPDVSSPLPGCPACAAAVGAAWHSAPV
jgi:hypothetical protein